MYSGNLASETLSVPQREVFPDLKMIVVPLSVRMLSNDYTNNAFFSSDINRSFIVMNCLDRIPFLLIGQSINVSPIFDELVQL